MAILDEVQLPLNDEIEAEALRTPRPGAIRRVPASAFRASH